MDSHKVNLPLVYLSLSGAGIIEFFCYSYGAYAGIPALCFFIPCFIIATYILGKQVTYSSVLNCLTSNTVANLHQRAILICYALFMLITASVAICVMVWILKIF